MTEHAPVDPIKVGVIGCGHWGKNLVRNFHAIGALDLVCEDSSSAQALARQIAPGVEIVTNIEKMLASDIRGVVIATPAETHYALAKAALDAGKDVLVEKPLALTYDQGCALVKLAAQQGRILMVGHVLEYHPGVARVFELVRSGELGKVQYIYSNRLSLGKVRREENILWSFAPHDIAILLRLIGDLPLQVSACGGAYLQPNIADVTVTHLLFDNGVRAHIYVSWLHPFKEQRLVIVGSEKMASYDDVSKKLMLYDQHVRIEGDEPIPVKGDGKEVPFDPREPLRAECEAFLAAIETGKPPLTDGESGLRVLRVLQAAQRSLMTGGAPVSLPAEPYTSFTSLL